MQIEDRIPRTILADLEARGHTFTKVGRKGEVKYGYAAVAVVDPPRARSKAAPSRADRTGPRRRSHGMSRSHGGNGAMEDCG